MTLHVDHVTHSVLTLRNDMTLHVVHRTHSVLTVCNDMTLCVVHVTRTVQRASTPETADDNYYGQQDTGADNNQCHYHHLSATGHTHTHTHTLFVTTVSSCTNK
jgi:hypothetical protein